MSGASGGPWEDYAAAPAAASSGPWNDYAAPRTAQRTGYVANAAAGGNEAIAGLLGAPVDLVTGGINLATRGVNAVAGTSIPAIADPVGGSGSIKRAMGVVGANPDDVRPDGTGQAVVRAAVGGATSALLPAGVPLALGRAGMMAAPTVARTTQALGGITLPNAALGATSGVAAERAATLAPDEYKPLAGLAGGLAGVGVPLAGLAAGRGAANALSAYLEPAGLTGRRNPLFAGAPAVTEGQARVAARRVDAAATDPAAVRAALAEPPAELVPGSAPTTFQATQDPGLGQLERGVSRATPEGAAAFRTRADEQNAARVRNIDAIAPEAQPGAVPQVVQARRDALTAERDARVGAAQGQADASLDGIGGVADGGLPEVGQRLRARLDEANQAARGGERDLWDAIDPDGTLNINVTPIRDRARVILREQPRNAGALPAAEAEIMDLAASVPDVQPFRELTALRSKITTAIRQERASGAADDQSIRRMSQLLDGVHEAMVPLASRVPDAPPAPVAGTAARSIASDAEAAPTLGTAVFTPGGRRVDVRYRVVEADDVVPSQLDDGRLNPAYPQELQPRDRTRRASEQQVGRIANTLEPERLGASASTAEGAPLIGPDGIVESGNGRTLAIRQAYAQAGERAQAYRDWPASQGYDVRGMRSPMLVRERTTSLTPEERPRFADEAGAAPTLAMSAAERAAADAKRLPDDVLDLWRGGDVTDARNVEFARAFAQRALPEGEQASFITAEGKLSEEGAARVRHALTQRAYGSNSLVAALAESADENIRAFGGALVDASGAMAKMRAGIAQGTVDAANDISPALIEAVGLVQQARRRGVSLADAVAQRDAFSERGPLVEAVLQTAYGADLKGRMSRSKLADLLSYYADEAQVQAGLFGANRGAADILQEAGERYGYGTTGRGGQKAGGQSGGDGPSIGPDGDQARGPGAGAQRQADGAGRSQGGASSDLTEPPLTANFDQPAADRYGAARQATADRAATFKSAPGVGEVLRPGVRAGEFRLPDSSVPAALFKRGPGAGSTERVLAFLRAGGSADDLTDYAAWSLRRTAVRDGALDPAKFATWARDHDAALSALPGVRERFATAAAAQEQVEQVTAQYAAAVREYEKSAARHFLGDADPVTQVASILRSRTATAEMAELARLTANDPAAREGLRRAVAEFILRDLKGDKIGAGAAETQLKGAALQAFIRKAEPALRRIMDERQVQSLRAVAEDIQRSDLSVAGTRVGGGSDTVQNAAAAAGSRGDTLLARLRDNGLDAVAGASVGTILGGPVGGFTGAAAGIGGRVLRGMREAGLRDVDALVTQAMLDPALMRVLLSKATPANEANLMRTLAAQLARVSVVSIMSGQAAEARSDQNVTRRAALPTTQRNALLDVVGVPTQPQRNALSLR